MSLCSNTYYLSYPFKINLYLSNQPYLKTSRAEPEYINIHPPPSINAQALPLSFH